ncbi:MAG: T9SS type A sorting domain-containing protein [Ignavibacteria bacterium]|nr:T9SS type A sorting domain-containing protein [Ignavibacteria bacterium]
MTYSELYSQNSDWTYRNTNPQNDFYGIKFFNQNTGYVIGSGGVLLKNVSGSNNWINIPTYTTRDLYALYFFDVNSGYIVGDRGTILYTSNGGTNWTSIVANNSYALRSITFVNQNTGFAAGDRGELYKTTNGITGWLQINVTSTNLKHVYFYDQLTGFVCGDSGKILRTTNCGIDWSSQTIGNENLYSVGFINLLTGYITTRNGGMKTTNSGNNWSSFMFGYGGQENRVKFADANTGYMYGMNGPISRTTNGGTNWSAWCSAQLFSGNTFTDLSIVDSNNVFACGAGGWILKCFGQQMNQTATHLGGSKSPLSRISFTSLSTGAMIGQSSLLFTTSNGGDNWNISLCGNNSWFEGSSYLTGLWLFSPTSWYRKIYSPGLGGFSYTSIHQSTDGGVTWAGNRSYGTYSLGDAGMNVSEAGGTTYVTSYSNILKNSGSGWSTIYTGSPTGSICFADANTGLAAIHPTGFREVLFTSNGGANWTTHSTGSTKYIESVYLRTSGLGFIGCDSALLLRTTNFGQNFSQVPVPNNLHVQNIRFVNDVTGWFLGVDHTYPGMGRLFVSNNGGTSFQQMLSLMNFDVKGFSFVDPLNGYVCGDSGKVLKTTNGGLTFVSHDPVITPQEFSLSQNYPNPFNPGTNFGFRIADFGLVKLTIYDALGKEVAIIVNEEMQPGIYSVNWDASNYPSGVYFYKLQSGEFVESKKMILIK